MRVSQPSLAWLLVAGLLIPAVPAAAGGKPKTEPGKYTAWGEDEFDEIEIVQPFKFAEYSGVAVTPLDVSKVPPRTDNEAKNLQEAIAGVDEAFLTGVKKGVSSH